jgi:mRNA interferase MazF
MKRGDIVTVATQGDYGKPRPAVVVQTDALNETHGTVLVCPMTTHVHEVPLLWIDIEPSAETGLLERSQVMADRIVTVRRDKVGKTIGQVEAATMSRLTQTLAMLLGIGD